jgi:hypothetical protein
VSLQGGFSNESFAGHQRLKMNAVIAADHNLRIRQAVTDHLLYYLAIHRLSSFVQRIGI